MNKHPSKRYGAECGREKKSLRPLTDARLIRKSRLLVPALLDWFEKNARDLPWRATSDAYAIWVSEIMLQQTQVKTVLPYWHRWMAALPRIQDLAEASTSMVHKLWEGLGYYTRVRNMQKAANIIVDDHAGKFPREYEQVLALPGIGRYTAGAICSIAFNEPRPILDGNVMRVLTRIFGIGQNPRVKETNEQLWEISERLVRQAGSGSAKNGRACSQLNQALMELGALVCKPRQPRCEVCPVSKYCTAYREGRVEELPNLERRLPPTQRRFMAFVAQQKNLFWVRQRPAGVVNAHLWEFPNLEVATTDGDFRTAARNVLGRSWLDLEPLTTVRHSITRYRIRLDVFRARTKSARSSIPAEGAWCSRAQLDALAFASAHKKIVATLPHPPPSQEHKETAF